LAIFTVWHGFVQYGPFMLLQTMLGGFPFLHLLAAYALIFEQQYRKQVLILGAIYFSLVVGYLLHTGGDAVFFGERFHFEGFFALALLAARGTQLLVENWQVHRRSVAFALVVLCGVQLGEMAWAVQALSNLGEPYRKVRAAVSSPQVTGMVFLHDAPGFVAKHFNLNDADWPHAARCTWSMLTRRAGPIGPADMVTRDGSSRATILVLTPPRSTRVTPIASCPTVPEGTDGLPHLPLAPLSILRNRDQPRSSA
jgi:hypothetical protein